MAYIKVFDDPEDDPNNVICKSRGTRRELCALFCAMADHLTRHLHFQPDAFLEATKYFVQQYRQDEDCVQTDGGQLNNEQICKFSVTASLRKRNEKTE